MKKVSLLFAATLICAPMLALADDTTPPATSTTSSSDDQNQIICRHGEPTTGSRIPGRSICHTKHAWDQIQRDSQGETNSMETKGTLTGTPGGG